MKSIGRLFATRLEFKILGLIILVLLISFSGIYLVMSRKERNNMIDSERVRSKLLADTIHETLDRDMMSFGADAVRFLMDDLKKIQGIQRIQIVRGNGPYVGDGRGRDEAFKDFKTLNDVKKRIPTLYRPQWEREHPTEAINVAHGIDNPDFREYFAKTTATLGEGQLLRTEETSLKRGLLDGFYFEEVDATPVMTYLRPLPNFPKCHLCHGPDHSLRGILMISTSLQGVQTALGDSQRYLFLASLTTLAILVVLLRILMKRMVLSPVKTMVARVRDIAEGEGDLTKRITVNYQDEIGDVARWFNTFIERLHHIISQVAGTGKQVNTVSQEILDGTNQIRDGSEVQNNAIGATSTAVEAMNQSIQKVAENAESLTAMAQESAVAVLEMSSSIDEIARNAAVLSTSVEDTTASILQMSSSIKQIDQNVSSLNSVAEVTSSSMTEMDAAIRQIRANVLDTVNLSKAVTDDAERGRRATESTIQGISKVQEYAQEMSQVIQHLNARTENIGKILNVIDEVADQTNLLALNAAIIAAQAGEHGRSFSVVAQEIKELADRTANSTSEIHDIIRSVQDESKNAVSTIGRSLKSVEEGVHLSEEAGNALNKILESSRKSTDRIQDIAKATDEQNQSANRVSEAMRQVSEMVQQIGHATHEQSKGSELIIQATERMKEIAVRVKSATHEQSVGNKQINEIVERVTRRVGEIAKATSKQAEESTNIFNAVSRIRVVIEQNIETIRKVSQAVEQMRRQVTQLSSEIDQFKV